MSYIIKEQSKYQEIAIAMDGFNPNEHVLYLDKAWQYASLFEYRYHETLATLPAVTCPSLTRVLICGGGDGLAARELLKFPGVRIDLVEIDERMIELYRTVKLLVRQNKGSLNSSRVQVMTMDAVTFAREKRETGYDLILLDFPSPGDGNADKSYMNLFRPEILEIFTELLADHGVISVQTSIPSDQLAPFARHLLSKGFYAWNYDATYSQAGNHDNFICASRSYLKQVRKIPPDCRLMTPEHIKVGFSEVTEINTLDLDYYRLFEFIEGIDVEPRS